MNDAPRAPAGPAVVWLARILSWLCVLGALAQAAISAALLAAPEMFKSSGGACTGDCISASADFDLALVRDPVFIAAYLAAQLVLVGSLLAAQRSFAGISKGDFFTHRTVAGLRNFAIGVFAYRLLSPFAGWLATTLRDMGKQHGSISLTLGFSDTGLLITLFIGAVILITALMAHAAKIAEENASFV